MSYSISSYTEDSFTFAACHGNRKDDPDGGGDIDDDDVYDDNEGLSINYVIADRGGGVSPKDYSIT